MHFHVISCISGCILLGFHLFLLWMDDKYFLSNFVVKYGNVVSTAASTIVLKDNVETMPF